MITTFICANCDAQLDLRDPQIGSTVECPICFATQTVSSLNPPELELSRGGLDDVDESLSSLTPRKKSSQRKVVPTINSGDYLCVPFQGQTQSSNQSPGRTLAAQLQDLLNDHEQRGWVFQRIDTVRVFINPGCLASIFGAQTQQREYDIVIFKRKA
ncbi:MAG: hypothetical protein K8I60_04960 [Anaerolineae bacterium]|nr:hypothetical protein [Anaerolineae bacterium]